MLSSMQQSSSAASVEHSTAGEKPPSYRWVVVCAFFGMGEAISLILMSLGVMLPLMTKDLGMSSVQSGTLASVTYWASILLTIPLSIWFSRLSPKWTATVAMVGSGFFTIVQAWAPSYEIELLARAAFVIGMVARTVITPLIIQQWFEAREVTLIQAISGGLQMIAQLAAYSATPFLMQALGGWRGVMFIYGILAFLTALMWQVLGRERLTEQYVRRLRSQERPAIWSAIRYKDVWAAGIGFIGSSASWTAFMFFWPTFLLEEKNIPLTMGGMVVSLVPLGCIFGSLICEPIIKMIGYKKPIIIATAIGMLVARLGGLWGDSVPVWMAFALLQGILVFLSGPILLSVPYEVKGIKPREVTVAAAIVNTNINIGSAIGPLVVGFISQTTGSWALAMGISAIGVLSYFVPGLLLPETGWRAEKAQQAKATALDSST